MKRYDKDYRFDQHKRVKQQRRQEEKASGFRCSHCREWVVINEYMGTTNRNHCNLCLWSKHVDVHKGDRRADCQAGMGPVGLTFKQEGYGRVGEIMLIHACSGCQKISINRVAGDDIESGILEVYLASVQLPVGLRKQLTAERVHLLTMADEAEIRAQLYGR